MWPWVGLVRLVREHAFLDGGGEWSYFTFSLFC